MCVVYVLFWPMAASPLDLRPFVGIMECRLLLPEIGNEALASRREALCVWDKVGIFGTTATIPATMLSPGLQFTSPFTSPSL